MHRRPKDPALLVDTGEECPGWSKAITNRHGVLSRSCKCGRARIVKVTRLGLQDMFMPELDGEALPPYFKLAEAKDAVEAAAEGRTLPRATRPFRHGPLEYRHVDLEPEEAQAKYEQTKAWFRERVDGVKASSAGALGVLGLAAGATPEEIKLAVRRLKKQWHPDTNPSDEAPERFREVVEAAKVLGAA